MTALFSGRWHRVAALRPTLAPAARLRRQRVRGETWIVLALPDGGRAVRLNAAAWNVAGRMDGRSTLQQLWDAALARDDDAPTQDELIALVARLHEAGLLQVDRAADFARLLPARDRDRVREERASTLLAWRLPLGNPARLLARLAPLGRLAFSRAGLVAWALAVALLGVLAVQHAPELVAHARRWLATPRCAVLALVLVAPVKALHELAHALAVRRRGGVVRSAGVTFMMLMPLPWVDASAAAAFPRRRDRVLVGAAGMMAELAVASVALVAWLALPERFELARDTAFVALAITGVSTLLFNANPLQRLDGYFIATDLLGLTNLAPRSRQWWQAALQRAFLGAAAGDAPPAARGERPWLVAYAPLAWGYGVLLAALGTAWVGAWSWPLGVAAGALLGWQAVLRPALRLVRDLRAAAAARGAATRRWRRAGLATALVALAIAVVPWPRRTVVEGVVWPADAAQVRAEEDGIVDSLAAHDGQPVQAGDVVLRLANPALAAKRARQAARVAALETALQSALVDAQDGADVRAGDARAELDAAQAELDRLDERTAALVVRARSAGRVALPADLDARWFKRGALIGQVVGDGATTVRVAWPAADAGAAVDALRTASVRLASVAGTAWPAHVARDGAGAVSQLPSAALSERHGGPVATDPADRDDLKPLQPVVLVDVALDQPLAATHRIGERAWVRFDEGLAPLAWQAVTALRHAVAQRFNPQF